MSRAPHRYRDMGPEEQEELLSNFLVNSWSYSKVSTYVRNQIVFEMEAIYGLKSKRSASSIAGNGYHAALDYFFSQLKEGVLLELPALEQAAFEEIASIPANQWKLSKTLPTMELAVADALKDTSKLLRNFYDEKDLYLDAIGEITGVELYFDEFLTVNGVDIPLPCHGKIDLSIETKDGRTVIIDHKSKDSYTDEKEAALVIGIQAITYALGYEAKTGKRVDEVWFIENKAATNKNGAAQLHDIRVPLDDHARKLFELLLYENLRDMIASVKDPDHVYTINTADKFVDMAEVFDFWTRVQIMEVEDFNVDEGKKELVAKRMRKVRNSDSRMINPQIIKSFREKAASFIKYDLSVTNMTQSEKIEHVLKNFGVIARVAHTFEGYSSNTFLLEVSAGTKVANIFRYRLDLANGLDVSNVRIGNQLKVFQDKAYLSVDLSKKCDRVLEYDSDARQGWRIPLGIDNFGEVIYWDIMNHATPHMLVCGQTGSGKSVFLFNILDQVLEAGPQHVVILDPKREFTGYRGLGVDVLTEIWDIETAVQRLKGQMETKIRTGDNNIVLVIFDEFADAVANARRGKELGGDKSLEENMRIILQKGRSCGFRVIEATQRASTKIITGDAKVNLPVQVCFRVNKEVDSKVVLDEAGAESLAGKGDGLIKSPEYLDTIRFQSYYVRQKKYA